ncbi:MAG TPA: sigma-70 family RNA polymerase sigma factor [Bryobacteraceae bacterium]|nr:sigma-70 family RNA polymerase sigma factor [Bryobacteraceae bacterium]
MSQNHILGHSSIVQAPCEAPAESATDFDALFRLHYNRIAYAIARIVGDPARAEELAMETFWKFWQSPEAHNERAAGWLHRVAINLGLYELRRRARHARFERLFRRSAPATPEEIHAADEEQRQVRQVLSRMKTRDAELLLLRNEDFRYEDIAAALRLNPASVGTLIARARETFRKEYVNLYGEPRLGR